MRLGAVLALALCVAAVVVAAHRPSSRRDLRRAPQHELSAKVPRDVLDAHTLRAVRRAVRATQSDADNIIDYVVNGPGSGLVFGRLANFTDTIGNRVCGSPQLDAAVDYMLRELKADGLDNVHGETVSIPHWIRGSESIAMLSPRWHPMHMLSLGGSSGTGGKNLTAQALVVETFDELTAAAKAGLSQGKIIVFNEQCDWAAQPIDCYGVSVQYRGQGANAAHAAGGVAALVRSVTGFSIASPHTGMLDGKPSPVPAASITVEDAEMLSRIQARGIPITLSIVMNAQNVADAPGQNVVAELTGSVWPEQVVLVSGHLDSWDVGQGAMDDGGGMAISYLALTVMKRLGIVPKRTLRAVLWSCEEFGGIGAQQYYDRHKGNVSSMDLVMESDLGVFKPYGIQFAGNAQATAIMQQVGTLLDRINCSAITGGADGTDIAPWMGAGVPGASLANENDAYFDFHHSDGDTMTVMNSDFLDMGVATWAVTALGVANLDTMLPR